MPKAATKRSTPAAKATPAKPAPRPAAAPSKAAQAAQHQGRPTPAEPKRPEPARQNLPATRPSGAVADPSTVAHLPAYMRDDAGKGLANIGNDDIVIPRLKLMQGLSPELQEFDGLRIGNFFHPAAEFIFDQPFRAVPLYYDKRYILWQPRDMGGGILARADDGVHWTPSKGRFDVTLNKKDGGAKVTWDLGDGTVAGSGLANWGSMNPNDRDAPPAATLTYNFLLAFPDEPDLMPAIFSFQRTGIKEGRKFLTKLKTQRAPIFGTVWEFGSQADNRGQNEFFVPTVKGAGLVEDDALYAGYKQMYDTYVSKGVSIKDIETMNDDGNDISGDNTPEDSNAPKY